jgi:Rrf2 family cysteine metabolism transcriptional repressor
MKLSTKGRYGVKAMFDLALHANGNPIPLRMVAQRQDISESYLEQLISGLRKAGLVKSIRGAQGGYMLATSPDKITVGQIIRVLEGSMAPADCVVEDDFDSCEKAEGCVIRIVWERIRDSINEVVDSITLQDMLENYNKIHKGNSQ